MQCKCLKHYTEKSNRHGYVISQPTWIQVSRLITMMNRQNHPFKNIFLYKLEFVKFDIFCLTIKWDNETTTLFYTFKYDRRANASLWKTWDKWSPADYQLIINRQNFDSVFLHKACVRINNFKVHVSRKAKNSQLTGFLFRIFTGHVTLIYSASHPVYNVYLLLLYLLWLKLHTTHYYPTRLSSHYLGKMNKTVNTC